MTFFLIRVVRNIISPFLYMPKDKWCNQKEHGKIYTLGIYRSYDLAKNVLFLLIGSDYVKKGEVSVFIQNVTSIDSILSEEGILEVKDKITLDHFYTEGIFNWFYTSDKKTEPMNNYLLTCLYDQNDLSSEYTPWCDIDLYDFYE